MGLVGQVGRVGQAGRVGIEHVALLVNDYQPAIDFFVNVLNFELVEDSPSLTNDGRPKRWVVVRPPGG
ncbi:MAG TPA: VOC family protein, partial [Vicinamibacterales bacterium]|nr:VOC family protein [Vicinamibacterales bacterium]